MSDMKIAIKDYEIIESLQANFKQGFTCITGQSNQGKSALFRAIERLLYNNHSDDSVRHGATAYMIGLEVDGNKVICKRNPTKGMKTTYSVNGKTLQKVGRTSLEEVSDVLNMGEVDIAGSKATLNIEGQFSYPFMLDLTPGKLYTFISQSSNQEDLTGVIKSMKDDLRTISDSQKKLEGVVSMAKETYDRENTIYNNLTNADFVIESILNLQPKVTEVDTLTTLCNRLSICDSDALFNDNELVKVYEQLTQLIQLDDIVHEYDTISNIKSHCMGISNKVKEYKVHKTSIETLNSMLDSCDLDTWISSYKYTEGLSNEINTLNKDIHSILDAVELRDRYSSSLNILNNLNDGMAQFEDTYSSYILSKEFIHSLSSAIRKVGDADEVLSKTVSELSYIDSTLQDIENELNKFDICPTCGHNLKED